MTLFISSPNGFSEHFCDFMPASEDDVWNPVESLIDSTIIPVNSSWFMIIQLVVLYKCLEAILGPLHYFPNQDDQLLLFPSFKAGLVLYSKKKIVNYTLEINFDVDFTY